MITLICLQPVRKPPSENSSLASGKSGSSSAAGKSGSNSDESNAEKGYDDPSLFPSRTFSGGRHGSGVTGPRNGSGAGHYPKNLHSSQSSVEKHYPKSNGSNPYGYIKLTTIFPKIAST